MGTIQLALKLGVKQFSSYFNAYGLTGPTGIDLPNEAQSLYHEEENMTLVNLASSSFGQSIGITPIQMITAASAVVNGGKLVTPMWWTGYRTRTAMWWRRSAPTSSAR